jgi:hypothetical protein
MPESMLDNISISLLDESLNPILLEKDSVTTAVLHIRQTKM